MNNYTIFDARLVAAPETNITKDGTAVTTARVADNPMGKKDDARPARFVKAKAFGAQADAMGRLSKGDVITVTGELSMETWPDKKTGETRTGDVMRVSAFRVQKSDSFFAGQGNGGGETKRAPKSETSLDDLFGAP